MYMRDDALRTELVATLRREVIERHTYDIRAKELVGMLDQYFGLLIPKLDLQRGETIDLSSPLPAAVSALKKSAPIEPAATCDFVSAPKSICIAVRTMHAHRDSIENLLVSATPFLQPHAHS